MTELISLICPSCDGPIAAVRLLDKAPVAKRFEDCLRRCEACGVAASNAAHSRDVTFIYRDPLENIPIESREGAIDALSRSLNVRSRQSKRSRFGFTTSEDALTWVVFTYLLRSGHWPSCEAPPGPRIPERTGPKYRSRCRSLQRHLHRICPTVCSRHKSILRRHLPPRQTGNSSRFSDRSAGIRPSGPCVRNELRFAFESAPGTSFAAG
jgi:hypothetical protein